MTSVPGVRGRGPAWLPPADAPRRRARKHDTRSTQPREEPPMSTTFDEDDEGRMFARELFGRPDNAQDYDDEVRDPGAVQLAAHLFPRPDDGASASDGASRATAADEYARLFNPSHPN